MIILSGLIAAAALTAGLQDSASQQPRLSSVTINIDGKPVEIRYARRGPNPYPPPVTGAPTLGGPALAGLGGVPYGELWQDEPITVVTPIAVSIAGLDVPPGTYTLYALPGETEWGMIVARSLAIQGDSAMVADMVGSFAVAREWTRQPVDTFTVRADPESGAAKAIVLTWERTLVRIPLVPVQDEEFSGSFRSCVRRGVRLFLAPPAGRCHPVPEQFQGRRRGVRNRNAREPRHSAGDTTATIIPPRPMPVALAADTACQKVRWGGGDTIPDDERRVSPLDSVTFTVGGAAVKLCYGRPSLRGRVMIGGRGAPYGMPWRTGANEPTIFFAPITLSLAGLTVPPGTYSLYTVPGETAWTIVVNRAYRHWGSDIYSSKVRAQELGHATVKREWSRQPIETFTIRAEPLAAQAKALVLEWERTRVRIPVAPHGP